MTDDHPPPSAPGDGGTGGARAGDAVAHLQTAARELIAAARGFLDVAEELLDEPNAADRIADSLASLGRLVSPDPPPPDGERESRVEHIDLD